MNERIIAKMNERIRNLGARSGLYLLSCSKCKQTLTRDWNSDWSEVWWWSKEGDLWEYKEHDEDGGLLDLRGFTCDCSGEIETKAIFWIWSRMTTEIKYFKVRIECNRGDSKYIVDQLNQLTKERGWNIKIE